MKTKTYGYKGTARMVGILYIIGTVAGILSTSFLSMRNETDYLVKIAENPNALVAGAILTLVMGFALTLIPMFDYQRVSDKRTKTLYRIRPGSLQPVRRIQSCQRAVLGPAYNQLVEGV
ncbi:MAG: DUF4386 domain-containing protein [Clostridiales bacterium]|nr:DUF4386 domain-containing protein [Clostridiales bacterium]